MKRQRIRDVTGYFNKGLKNSSDAVIMVNPDSALYMSVDLKLFVLDFSMQVEVEANNTTNPKALLDKSITFVCIFGMAIYFSPHLVSPEDD